MFVESFAAVHDKTFWSHLPATNWLRAQIRKQCWRACAVVWQLITHRYSNWPWRIFELLLTRTEACAKSLLQSPQCLRCPLAEKFLSAYPTPEALLSETAFQHLSLFAAMLVLNTFDIERHHSANMRQAKSRVQVKRMDTSQLAQRHAACSCLPWLRRTLLSLDVCKDKKKRGRPPKQKAPYRPLQPPPLAIGEALPPSGQVEVDETLRTAELEDDIHGRPPKKRRTGGGGAARAFIHVQGQGKRLTKELWQQYHDLSAEDRAYYQRLGAAGP
eukprot:5416291-Amphidinium_carterae.1